ncbi:MAG TPA: hypothetical protein VGK27_10670 [Candidatus Deferrimicrobiaceae bacterium]
MREHRFRNSLVVALFLIPLLAASSAKAEIRTISWSPVTQYTDNSTIPTGVGIDYTVYWTTDNTLATASLKSIADNVATTSATFDPDLKGMVRQTTVYFTIKTVLSDGMESLLAPAFAWLVPAATPVPPPPPTLTGISISGPSSVNEGTTGAYSATATWSDNTTTSVTPGWSVTGTGATIGSTGVLTAGNVTANQSVTVTASYTGGGVTKSASKAVTIAYVAPTLTGISISGPSSVNEGTTGAYSATATWSDTTTTVVVPTWSVTGTGATIGSTGVLTAGNVTANQSVTVTASYTGGGVTKSASKAVTIAYVAPTLTGLTISGPASVNGGATGAYTATATWSDTTTTVVVPTWSVTGTGATIGSTGVLTAGKVTASQAVTVTASYVGGGVTKTASQAVTIAYVAPTLTGLTISGPASVNEGTTVTYTATATWSDNTATPVTPTWSVTTTYATISSAGVLTAGTVTANQAVTVSASYVGGGVTKTASQAVTVVNVASRTPATPVINGVGP